MTDFSFNSVIAFYWAPAAICLIYSMCHMYILLKEDIAKRFSVGYRAQLTVGVMFFAVVIGFVPAINILMTIFVVIPEVFSGAFKKISYIMDLPVIPAKSKD